MTTVVRTILVHMTRGWARALPSTMIALCRQRNFGLFEHLSCVSYFLVNILALCIKSYDTTLFNALSPGARITLKALFWVDAVGCMTKMKVRLLDPKKSLFSSGKSAPRHVASHVGKENRIGPAMDAVISQFPGVWKDGEHSDI